MGEAATKRADYASTRDRAIGAFVESVEEGSPAWEVGIEPGMRIAQLVIAAVASVAVEVSDTLSSSERGAGGYGSTGV